MNSCFELKNRNFLLLFIGSTISQIGTVIYDVALIWWLTESTGTSKSASYILSASILGITVISPFSGVLSDYLNKKKLLIITDTLSGLICIGIALMSYFHIINIVLLTVLSFFLGVNSSLFMPSSGAILPELIDKEKLVKANSLMSNVSATFKIIGPMLAGVFLKIKFWGVPLCFAINGISFILSAIAESFIQYEFKKKPMEKKLYSVLINLKLGFEYLIKQKAILTIVTGAGVVNFFLASFNILMPIFIIRIMNLSSNYYSSMLTGMALGAVICTLILLRHKSMKPDMIVIVYSMITLGIIYTVFTIHRNMVLMLILSFVIGFLETFFSTNFVSYVQYYVKQEYLGRVFSLVSTVITGLIPVAYLIYGYFGELFLDYIFIYAGIGITLSGVALLAIMIPIRHKSTINEE